MSKQLHHNIWFIIFLIVVGNISLSIGQEISNIKFTNLDSEDGLPNNHINDIISDHLGFIWMATNDGLCRYDGPEKFKIFQENDPLIPNGIKSSNIHTIHEDKNHNLWIGTRLGGLSCLHQPTGTWTTYLHDPKDSTSISNNEILSILEDSQGRLWFGTENGLNLFDPINKKFISFKADKNNPSALQEKAILSIAEDHKGWIWVGTWAGGLHLLLPDKNGDFTKSTFRNFEYTDINGPKHIWKIYQDGQNRYWLGSHNRGLILMQLPETANNTPTQQTWNPIFHHYPQYKNNLEHSNSLSSNQINDIYEDRQGRLWIATVFGLNYIKSADLVANNVSHKITKDKPEFIFHKKYYDSSKQHSLVHSEINTIYEDRQGLIWFGTFGGISKYDPSDKQFSTYNFQLENGQSPEVENVFIGHDNKAWFGMIKKGLYQYDFNKKEFTQILNEQKQPLIDDYVYALYSPNDIDLYITGSQGVYILNTHNLEITHFSIPVWVESKYNYFYAKRIFVDRQENIWLGTEFGLFHLDKTDGSFTHFSYDSTDENTISDNSITDIVEDEAGYLWISTYNGLNRLKHFSRSNVSIKRFKSDINNPKSIPFNRLTCLSYFNDTLYLGTTSGIYSYDIKRDTFKNLNNHNYKRCIQSIENDFNGNVWASTTEGILHVDVQHETLNFFKESDSISELSFKIGVSATDKNENIYFGSRNGFTRLHPKLSIKNTVPPPIYFTDIRTVSPSGEKLQKGTYIQHLDIQHDAYALSIEFTSLNYNKPKKNQYAYKLEGLDTDWVYIKKLNPAVYTNLEPGSYTFRVKAANNDGVWNNEGKELNITVEAAIWETWYFKVAMVILAACILWFLIMNYTRRIKHRNQSLERYNKNLNHEIQERKRVERALQEREQYMEYLVQQRTVELEIKNKEVKTLLNKIQLRNEELESIVAKRTAKLQEFNKDLQRSNQDLEQFAYIASHDLQEPLRIISSFLGLLTRKYKTRLDSTAFEYINFALDASERMSALIKSLLTYSKVGRNELIVENTDLNLLLEEKLLDLSQLIKERKAEININPLPIIKCERNQIAMVFYNLINNAIKFNKSEHPKVEISAELTEDNSAWQLSVKDNGIGIDPKFQNKIFEIFKRLHTNRDYEGTGIGLAVCQKIIERHQGTIWVNSVPEQGTTFTFTIRKQMTVDSTKHEEVQLSQGVTLAR